MSRVPTTIHEALTLAGEHLMLGRLADCESISRQILAHYPDCAPAFHLLGLVARQTGKLSIAVELIGRAIRLDASVPQFHSNLGDTLLSALQFESAIESYRRALELNPESARTCNSLGIALQGAGRLDEAAAAHRKAIELRADFAEAHNNLGNVLREQGQTEQAIAAYRAAIGLNPALAQCHANLGGALFDDAQIEAALESYRQATSLDPRDPITHSKLLYILNFHPGFENPAAICAEHQEWSQRHAQPLARLVQPHSNDLSPDRRLKIGYVSADFRDHVVGRNLLPLFRHHDQSQFEIFCYANLARPDETTGKFREMANHWREIAAKSDDQVASLIRADQIDILVDLSLHLVGNRLLVFARKPAPVQVTFAGYPGTTGLDAIDYRLTDPHLDPADSNDGDYSERSLRLPETFWCFEPIDGGPEVNPLPAQTNGLLTFGCLNNFCKVNALTLAGWSKILNSIADSRLVLMAPPGAARQRVVESLRVDPNRIEFVDRQPRIRYLELYHRIDLCLDTFPYNGHSTSLDAFWMGVPVVSRAGRSAVSRAGLSQASNLGLADLVGATEAEFVQIAVNLAGDLSRLSDLHRTLRQRMHSSPLMDAPRFARGIEAAYREIWRRWCSGGRL